MMRTASLVTLLLVACGAPATSDGGSGGGSPTGGGGGALTGGGSATGGAAGGGAGGGQATGGAGGGGSASGGGGGGTQGTADTGTPCSSNGECASGQCLSSFRDAGAVCASPCGDQTDCAALPGFFCDAAKDGGGLCLPNSPAHCLPCDFDSDCGPLGEVCVLAPGDTQSTCRIDCSLAGADACPSDYTCSPVMLNGVQRSLCMPPAVGCAQSQGGFCDRYAVPQPCSNSNDAGTCLGNRTCVNGRYSRCDAVAPGCKPTCNTIDPTGCTEALCPTATQTVTDCGACGRTCPGADAPGVNVTCTSMQACTFSCQGEKYDVDNDATTGCEVTDGTTGNHSTATASNGGTYDCFDSSTISLGGLVPSDTRVHENPTIAGFDVASGSAPDFIALHASGGTFCVNDVNLTLTAGLGTPACLHLDVITDKGGWSCAPPAGGACTISQGSGSYSGGTIVSVKVSRTCSAAAGSLPYTLTGHL